MYAYPGTSYWDAYKLPIPIRKWLIRTYNKRIEEQEKARTKQAPTNRPLNVQEKLKINQDLGQTDGRISKPFNFMQPIKK